MFLDNLLDFENKFINNFRFNSVVIILNCKCMVSMNWIFHLNLNLKHNI